MKSMKWNVNFKTRRYFRFRMEARALKLICRRKSVEEKRMQKQTFGHASRRILLFGRTLFSARSVICEISAQFVIVEVNKDVEIASQRENLLTCPMLIRFQLSPCELEFSRRFSAFRSMVILSFFTSSLIFEFLALNECLILSVSIHGFAVHSYLHLFKMNPLMQNVSCSLTTVRRRELQFKHSGLGWITFVLLFPISAPEFSKLNISLALLWREKTIRACINVSHKALLLNGKKIQSASPTAIERCLMSTKDNDTFFNLHPSTPSSQWIYKWSSLYICK